VKLPRILRGPLEFIVVLTAAFIIGLCWFALFGR
jgi:hypothetical protein